MHVREILADSSFEGNLIIPTTRDAFLGECLSLLEVRNIGYIDIDPWVHSKKNNCHNNVLEYIEWYGGKQIKGYYWLVDQDNQTVLAISHSVVRTLSGQIRDITPCDDQRDSNLFSLSDQSSLELSSSSKVIYGFSFSLS